jgi:hypothetical protein
VDFTHEPNRYGQFAKPLQAIVHGSDVINDFFDIVGMIWLQSIGLELQNIHEGCLSALDLTGKNCLLANVHVNEQVGVWKGFRRSVQTA